MSGNTDSDFGEIAEKLNSSLFSDVLDSMGYRNQAMNDKVRPVYPGATIVGKAHTMQMVDVHQQDLDTFPLQLQGIDALKNGDIMVVASNGSTEAALWGELLSTAARIRGARGAVIDGFARDIKLIEEMKFPVFATGFKPISSRGRVMAISYNERIKAGGVYVYPDDLIVGDVDGDTYTPPALILSL